MAVVVALASRGDAIRVVRPENCRSEALACTTRVFAPCERVRIDLRFSDGRVSRDLPSVEARRGEIVSSLGERMGTGPAGQVQVKHSRYAELDDVSCV